MKIGILRGEGFMPVLTLCVLDFGKRRLLEVVWVFARLLLLVFFV